MDLYFGTNQSMLSDTTYARFVLGSCRPKGEPMKVGGIVVNGSIMVMIYSIAIMKKYGAMTVSPSSSAARLSDSNVSLSVSTCVHPGYQFLYGLRSQVRKTLSASS